MSSPQSLQKSNWKAAVFWGIVLGLSVYAITHRDQVIALFSGIQIPQFDFTTITLDKIVEFLQKYGILITGGFAAFSFIYNFYQNHKNNQLTQKLLQTQQNAEMQSTQMTNDYVELQRKYEGAIQSQTPKIDLSGYTKEISELKTSKEELQSQLNEMSQYIKVIQSPTPEEMIRRLADEYTVTRKAK